MPSVLQEWVMKLPYMQQSVLLTAVRGPDGITKEHPAKEVLRWYRRCVLLGAFEGRAFLSPSEPGGGSFTGPATRPLDQIANSYFECVDELPHHFQMHLMHAAQIIGYKHPSPDVSLWWRRFYLYYVDSLHLRSESKEDMDRRLGDSESQWRESEAWM